MTRSVLIVNLLIVVVCGLVLISGGPFLSYEIIFLKKLPLAIVFSLVGIIALSLLALISTLSIGVASQFAKLSLYFSLLWFPISYALAGNIRLDFNNDKIQFWYIWLAYTLTIVTIDFILIGKSIIQALGSDNSQTE